MQITPGIKIQLQFDPSVILSLGNAEYLNPSCGVDHLLRSVGCRSDGHGCAVFHRKRSPESNMGDTEPVKQKRTKTNTNKKSETKQDTPRRRPKLSEPATSTTLAVVGIDRSLPNPRRAENPAASALGPNRSGSGRPVGVWVGPRGSIFGSILRFPPLGLDSWRGCPGGGDGFGVGQRGARRDRRPDRRHLPRIAVSSADFPCFQTSSFLFARFEFRHASMELPVDLLWLAMFPRAEVRLLTCRKSVLSESQAGGMCLVISAQVAM
jgi:hypothetical protein